MVSMLTFLSIGMLPCLVTFHFWIILFIYIMNSCAERLHPCLTPHFIIFRSEVSRCKVLGVVMRLIRPLLLNRQPHLPVAYRFNWRGSEAWVTMG
jgi:hypothetical protein